VEFSPSLVASEWEQVASKAIVAFDYALAYDCSQNNVVSKTGMGCVEACAKWEFLSLYVPDELAEKRALGYISPDGEACQLPDAEHVATVASPTYRGHDIWCLTASKTLATRLPYSIRQASMVTH
jgi:hypothetical protein